MKKILVVDDEKEFLLSLSDGLRMANDNFNIITAENADRAIDILKAVDVDLLVTDIKMPVKDGFDLLQHVLEHRPNTPTLIMTAFLNNDVIHRLGSMGFYFFIEKPLEFDDLLGKIMYMLGMKTNGHHGIGQH